MQVSRLRQCLVATSLKETFGAVGQAFAVALFELVHVLLERRGLFQRMAQVQADDAQGQGAGRTAGASPTTRILLRRSTLEINTTTPAPRTKPAMEPKSSQLPRKPRLRSGAYSATKIDAPAYLTAHRETLGHLAQQQQDRRPDANGRIAGDQADGKGAQGHDHNGGGEDFLPSVFIAQRTEEQATQRANQERHGRRCPARRSVLYAGGGVREKNTLPST